MKEHIRPSQEVINSAETGLETEQGLSQQGSAELAQRLFDLDVETLDPHISTARELLANQELNEPDPQTTSEIIDELSHSDDLGAENQTRLQALSAKIKQLGGDLTRKTVLASLLFSTEAVTTDKVFAQAPEAPKTVSQTGTSNSQPEDFFNIRFNGKDMAIISGGDTDLMFKHNIEYPQTWTDLGKILLEPVSVGLNVEYGKNNYPLKLIFGDKDSDFTLAVEFPYEYARDFDNATPAEKEQMELKMQEQAKELLQQLLPHILSGSTQAEAFSQEAAQNRTLSRVKSLDVTGYASSESEGKLNSNDPRNLNLSGMRAENASQILQKILLKQGIEIEQVSHSAGGEIPLLDSEKAELVSDAYRLELGKDGLPTDKALLGLIEEYNNGRIDNQQLLEKLHKVVGDKRKVMVNVEVGDKSGLIVLPLPLLIGLIGLIIRYGPSRLKSSDRSNHDKLLAHFLPRDHQVELEQELEQAAKIGKQNLAMPERDITRRDVVKSYSAESEPDQLVRDEVVGETRHRNSKKLSPRVRGELELNPDTPMEDRVGSLALILDRYVRMTPTLVGKKVYPNIAEKAADKYLETSKVVDLVNVHNDPEALEGLLKQIVFLENNQTMPDHFDTAQKIVRFEFMAIKNNLFPKAGKMRRTEVTGFNAPQVMYPNVYIGRDAYKIDLVKLANKAEEYLAQVKVKNETES